MKIWLHLFSYIIKTIARAVGTKGSGVWFPALRNSVCKLLGCQLCLVVYACCFYLLSLLTGFPEKHERLTDVIECSLSKVSLQFIRSQTVSCQSSEMQHTQMSSVSSYHIPHESKMEIHAFGGQPSVTLGEKKIPRRNLVFVPLENLCATKGMHPTGCETLA